MSSNLIFFGNKITEAHQLTMNLDPNNPTVKSENPKSNPLKLGAVNQGTSYVSRFWRSAGSWRKYGVDSNRIPAKHLSEVRVSGTKNQASTTDNILMPLLLTVPVTEDLQGSGALIVCIRKKGSRWG